MVDFEIRKAEVLRECEEVLNDIEILKERCLELKKVLKECNSYEDVLKHYPNDVNLEDGLIHISLF